MVEVIPPSRNPSLQRNRRYTALMLVPLLFIWVEAYASEHRSDFNGDGFDDLAIGVPEEGFRRARSAGAVSVVYGSATGITTDGSQFWRQRRAEDFDGFGSALS